MKKNVKWSVISVSTITALTFGGLVMNNEKASGNENSVPTNNNVLQDQVSNQAYEENTYTSKEGEGYYGDHDDDDDEGYEDEGDDHYQEQGTVWGQEQVVKAPDKGFQQQKSSSSRTSR